MLNALKGIQSDKSPGIDGLCEILEILLARYQKVFIQLIHDIP